ncbi:MAG: hypothetical protein A3G49_03510 [Candidatus Sungbacteria bacterium RIFCSPLOWO2_12_FULL_41_11]|uniref:Nucleoside 2-deoxyribosyltransferase n=1 Tax=Candidatus Sungbacteria bacterium RIFCSPLOWO2_12_FULL_41_11 TaxID=1802286 RepID=A0A1G2LT31_9BACT|nr:MAG: hypothetical protein A3D41_03915 [Candidatus Sungbacteria bacterium RIFCSPHIGHO2_02_FULL_41_12b]OHA14767.1 MAG: hypothetical protein A3G49_03510 [Candidatus Sungbacteria bacterium RIFCSPLOWO2_12_FULL_41_11]
MPFYIYFCGGMRPNKNGIYWQDIVRKAVPPDKDIRYLDPCKKRKVPGENEDLQEFFALDLFWAGMAHIIFVNMEPTNPGGHMGALEIGYVLGQAGREKLVIIVNQDPSDSDNALYRYRGVINAAGNPNKVYKTIDEGIVMLKRAVAQFRENPDAKEAYGE